MKTLAENGGLITLSPGVKNNSGNTAGTENNIIEENGQMTPQPVEENYDADEWYNESAI